MITPKETLDSQQLFFTIKEWKKYEGSKWKIMKDGTVIYTRENQAFRYLLFRGNIIEVKDHKLCFFDRDSKSYCEIFASSEAMFEQVKEIWLEVPSHMDAIRYCEAGIPIKAIDKRNPKHIILIQDNGFMIDLCDLRNYIWYVLDQK
jgi:hypothetical protein